MGWQLVVEAGAEVVVLLLQMQNFGDQEEVVEEGTQWGLEVVGGVSLLRKM